ncbi:MAG TPA: hypothetical protein VGM80_12550 [Gaiellaceae bacterium]
MRFGSLAFLAVLVASPASAGGAAAAPVQQTIAYQSGHIRTVAQNAHVVSWITLQSGSCQAVIRLRNLAAHTQQSLNTASGPTCSFETDATDRLAVAHDTQAIWVYSEFGNDSYFHLIRGQTGGGADHEFDQLEWGDTNNYAVTTAGADTTGVIGWYQANLRDDCLDGSGPTPCPTVVYEGGVKTAAGAAVPGAPPAGAVAGSSGRVAILVAGTVGAPPTLTAGDVQIRTIATGALVGHFTAGAPVKRLSLSPAHAAVLLAGRIKKFSLAGAAQGTVPVASTAAELSISDSWIVYCTGSTIHAIPFGGGAAITIHAASTPRGLSVWNKRVVWAETYAAHRSRIQSVTLP